MIPFLLILLVLVCSGIYAGIVRRRTVLGQWALAAKNLGLELVHSGKRGHAGLLSGMWEDNAVSVENIHLSSQSNPTQIRTSIAIHLPKALHIQPKNTLVSGLCRLLGQGLKTGDEVFDTRFIVTSDDEHDALSFLSTEVRAAIVHYAASTGNLLLTEKALVHEMVGVPSYHSKIAFILDRQAELIHALKQQSARSLLNANILEDDHEQQQQCTPATVFAHHL